MRKTNHWIVAAIVGLTLSALIGCSGSKSSRFYLLSALSPAEGARDGQGMSLGIGPIEFPRYLDRPQIVTRGSGNRIYIGEFDRWAEPLEHNFARVLAENLAELLSTDNVVRHPWKHSAQIDYRVLITVNRFDATVGGDSVLHARWTVSNADGSIVVPTRASRIAESPASPGYEAIVQAGSRAVEQLSRQIATAIRATKSPGTGRSDG